MLVPCVDKGARLRSDARQALQEAGQVFVQTRRIGITHVFVGSIFHVNCAPERALKSFLLHAPSDLALLGLRLAPIPAAR